ncbi:hypothetical protein NDU88_005937 [Pleurodeles waltl]|uniref:Uncharacterized protein n=1 Tax=Pleurodeles waltl TaxID=8319 RepID=A0AAV7MXV4_PLEWA|nr:hypothetical protein NDU88_005937 [Pleurodeles waltl]
MRSTCDLPWNSDLGKREPPNVARVSTSSGVYEVPPKVPPWSSRQLGPLSKASLVVYDRKHNQATHKSSEVRYQARYGKALMQLKSRCDSVIAWGEEKRGVELEHGTEEVILKEIEVASSLTFFSEEEEGLRPPVIYICIVMDWGLVTCCHGFLVGIMGVEV